MKDLHLTIREQQQKMLELSDVRYVAQHLRHNGLGPYLLGRDDDELVKRIVADIDKVVDVFVTAGAKCDRQQAAGYILRGKIGPEPTGDAVNG